MGREYMGPVMNENKHVTVVIPVALNDIIHLDPKGFLDLISEKITASSWKSASALSE